MNIEAVKRQIEREERILESLEVGTQAAINHRSRLSRLYQMLHQMLSAPGYFEEVEEVG